MAFDLKNTGIRERVHEAVERSTASVERSTEAVERSTEAPVGV